MVHGSNPVTNASTPYSASPNPAPTPVFRRMKIIATPSPIDGIAIGHAKPKHPPASVARPTPPGKPRHSPSNGQLCPATAAARAGSASASSAPDGVRKDDSRNSLSRVPREHQHAPSTSHSPEDVGGAGYPCVYLADGDALASRGKVRPRQRAEQVAQDNGDRDCGVDRHGTQSSVPLSPLSLLREEAYCLRCRAVIGFRRASLTGTGAQ